ncbi:MAG: arginine N-succinyltransferase [Desulforhopalus sp.]
MIEEPKNRLEPNRKKNYSGKQVLGIVFVSTCIAIIATAFILKFYFFPAPFSPVELSNREAQQLTAKLESLNHQVEPEKHEYAQDGTLIPIKYSETGAARDISFTERELNALVAKNTSLAEKLAIDLAENMISVKLLIPLDPDLPMVGGQILRVKAGTELAYREGKPVIKFKGISLMGVPVPNAWLGGIKNIDLIKEFGSDEGFWKTFSDGIDSISVVEGFLQIRFKE